MNPSSSRILFESLDSSKGAFKMIRIATLFVCFAGAPLESTFAQDPQQLTDDASLLSFLEQVRAARYQFNLGNPEPSLALWSTTEVVTLMGGAGGMEKGLEEVKRRVGFASQRRTDGDRVEENRVEVEYLQIAVNDDFAYTVQIERRRVSAPGQKELVDDVLRATDVFRKENGDWKLVHRHADPLVEAIIPGLPVQGVRR